MRKPARKLAPVLLATAIAPVCATFLLLLAGAQSDVPRNALWEIVHNLCVPEQMQNHDPKPCAEVNLAGGIENGYAILKDLRGSSQYLLIPTAEISGIESSALLKLHSENYFADAWQARKYVTGALYEVLPRDDIGLAINSLPGRSQDQLHIHVDCIRPDVRAALHRNEASLGPSWTAFPVPLAGSHYQAMWLVGEDLGANNPFKLLADKLPGAARDMGERTLVVIGMTRADGSAGFALLEDEANQKAGDSGYGEGLLDHSCRLAGQETNNH
jgi:CDP-diacylglycerol pyrophosphatase